MLVELAWFWAFVCAGCFQAFVLGICVCSLVLCISVCSVGAPFKKGKTVEFYISATLRRV